MISKATFATVLGLVVQGVWAQCPDITTQVTYGATTSVTVSAGTRATITDPASASQDITILSCAEATVGPSATVNIDGGIATVSGTYIAESTTITRATANIIGSATVPVATLASFSVYATQTLSLTAASDVGITLDPSASLSVFGTLINVDAQGDGSTVYMNSNGGSLSIGGVGSEADLTLYGDGSEGISVFGSNQAQVKLRGNSYEAVLFESATGQVYGTAVSCTAVEGGTCIGQGNYATLVAGGAGFADMSLSNSTGNTLMVSFLGSGIVGGQGNTGIASSGGALQVVNTGRADIEAGADATIFPSVSEVTVSSSATATMYAAATVTAAPGAFLRVISPQTEIRSIGETDTFTVFEARIAPTGGGDFDRRRRRAQPTGVCGSGSTWCPNLRGVLNCVDIRTDIFNCGGCALAIGAGQDCTQIYDGAVACDRGVCVEL